MKYYDFRGWVQKLHMICLDDPKAAMHHATTTLK